MSPELIEIVLAGSRWLTFVGAVAIVGAKGAQLVAARAAAPQAQAFTALIEQRLPRLALLASILWTTGLLTMLAAQCVSWFGAGGLTDPEQLRQLIAESRWGAAWLKAFLFSGLALAAHVVARWRPALQPRAIVLASLAAVVATPLIGHAAGQGAATWLLHSLHLAGAGLWLGTLLMLAWSTWPLWSDRSAAAAGLRPLLTAFTPVALGSVALVGASGMLLTTSQIWPLGTIFETAYGAALSRKLVFVAVIAGLGALNWRLFRPGAEIEAGRRQLRRAVRTELALAFVVVLALTAWLSGVAPPAG